MSKSNHHSPLSDIQLRVKAMESILTDKGLVNPETLDTIIDHYENKVGPHLGAKLVARAWVDPEFKTKLLEDATSVVTEMGMAGIDGSHILVKENTPHVHNMIVCTLCSCYPWSVLGLPPTWYKSAPFRARAVREPRKLLDEFGITLDDNVEVRVWDSNADLRYLVLPMRPRGTEHLTEQELAAIVTRDAMIGTAVVTAPD